MKYMPAHHDALWINVNGDSEWALFINGHHIGTDWGSSDTPFRIGADRYFLIQLQKALDLDKTFGSILSLRFTTADLVNTGWMTEKAADEWGWSDIEEIAQDLDRWGQLMFWASLQT